MTFLHDAVCLPLSCADYTNKFNTLASTTRPLARPLVSSTVADSIALP